MGNSELRELLVDPFVPSMSVSLPLSSPSVQLEEGHILPRSQGYHQMKPSPLVWPVLFSLVLTLHPTHQPLVYPVRDPKSLP